MHFLGKNSKVKMVMFYLYCDVGSIEKNWKEHTFKRYNLYNGKDKLFVKNAKKGKR